MKRVFVLLFVVFCPVIQALPTGSEEPQIETCHELQLGDQKITYKTRTGTLVLCDDEGLPKASIFFMAYEREGVCERRHRPVTFCFNGGPGESSMWLHLGAFGPRRIEWKDKKTEAAVPLTPWIENPYSLLDVTDLVFVDPVGTGYSHPIGKQDKSQFLGFENDVRLLSEFVSLYVRRMGYLSSPKFLAGESYGTTRVVAMGAELRKRYGLCLQGLILIGSVLNWQHYFVHDSWQDGEIGNEVPYVTYLPSYAAIAWYHHRVGDRYRDRSLEEVLGIAEAFARGAYRNAMFQGSLLGVEEKQRLAQQLSELVGLPQSLIEEEELRITQTCFRKELLRNEKKTVSYFDGRVVGDDISLSREQIENDPFDDLVTGPFSATIEEYLSRELNWKTTERYYAQGQSWVTWSGSTPTRYCNVAHLLRQQLQQNPNLQVLIANGYYDLATPYAATHYTLEHMRLPDPQRKNIRLCDYPTGHMVYLDLPVLSALKTELTHFYERALQNQNSDSSL